MIRHQERLRAGLAGWTVRVCLPALLLLLTLPAAGQSGGVLRGRVVDKDGQSLPGAVLSVQSAKNPSVKDQGAVADAKGEFRLLNLPPGDDYQVTAAFPGMATIIQKPFNVKSDTTTSVNFIMVQELVTTIRVEAQGSVVDTATASTRTTVSEAFIANLPILGRSYTDLLTLAPGVTDTDGDGKPNVHGAREVDFQIRIDGVSVSDPFSGEDSSQINIEAIEEIQIILTGATAEYGRSQGGVGGVTTKSGGNDFEGSFKVYYQSIDLDNDGAHNQDAVPIDTGTPSFRTLKPFLTVGGPLVRDRAWYFLANQYIDQQEPINIIGVTRNQSIEGWNEFGKATWQINPSNKAVLTALYDPRQTSGNNIGISISPDSDYIVNAATPVFTLQETWVASPTVLLDSTMSFLNGRQRVRPTAEEDALPLPCASTVNTELKERTCDRIPSLTYTQKLDTGQISGPYWVDQDSTSTRLTGKQDLSFYVDDFLGSHQFKAGFEWLDEDYSTTVEKRPLRYEFIGAKSDKRLFLWSDFEERRQTGDAGGQALGLYLQDTWKIVPNLTINVGVRIDNERLRAAGSTPIDPAAERAAFNALAAQVYSNFNPSPGTWTESSGDFAEGSCDIGGPSGTPDGVCDTYDRIAISRVFTRHEAERAPSRFFTSIGSETSGSVIPPCGSPDRLGTCRQDDDIDIRNTNLAPRLSIAYDPFRDGKTKLYASYGRYYDRLFLATIIPEQTRDFDYISFQQVANKEEFELPGQRNFGVYQVSRDLRTPFSDELVVGIDRELTPEFSVSVRYITRKGRDQIQSRDINHYTIDTDFDGVPDDTYDDSDIGGRSAAGFPDTFPDLYALNPFFGAVLSLDNVNTSDYRGLEINLSKRLHRNWQFDFSYTWSEAQGFAEAFQDFFLGNDTSQVQNEFGFLDYDQTHVVKFNAVAQFPKRIQFGTRVTWESGLPFSLIRRGFTFDENANPTFRQIYPTAQRNDQRNGGRWLIDLNLRKDFQLGRSSAGFDFTVTNLLNSDDLEIDNINDGYRVFQLVDDSQRRFGRRFQLGFTMNY